MAHLAASALAGEVQPGSAAALIPGRARAVSRFVSLLRNMPGTVSSTISGAEILGQVAQEGNRGSLGDEVQEGHGVI